MSFWDGSTPSMRWGFAGLCGILVAFVLRLVAVYFDSALLTYASIALAIVALVTVFGAMFLPNQVHR